MVWLLLALAVAQGDPLDAELSEIIRRFSSPDAPRREAASKDLDAFCRKAGGKAEQYLRKHSDSSDPEVKARILSRLSFMARVQESQRLLAVFDLAELPSCAGKPLAIYNPNWLGSHNNEPKFQYLLGWVVSETKDEITLTDTNLMTRAYPRNRKLPPEWEDIKDRIPANLPLPGEYRSLKPGDFFKEFSYQEDTTYAAHQDIDLSVDGLGLALCAYRAFREGEDKSAFEFLEASRKGIAVMCWQEPEKPFPEQLRAVLADNLRGMAMTAANRGRPRPELLKNWKVVHQLAPHLNGGESGEMVKLYEKLVAEDASWKDPTSEELAAMAPAKQGAVWIHRLRDLDAYQMSNPGECSVFGPWHGEGRALENKTVPVNPAQELVKLAWSAVPLLIEGLEDRHPTRSEGGSNGPDHLLRIGDCCQQIFEAISGIIIWEAKERDQILSRDGKVAEAKAIALKWWEEHRQEGPEKYYLRRLDFPETFVHSVTRLLALDAGKHVPALVDLLKKGDRERRRQLLPLLRPHLTQAHREILESFLTDDGLFALVEASEALWQICGSPAGALELSRRLQAGSASKDDLFWLDHRIFALFEAVESDRIVEEVCTLTKSAEAPIRCRAMSWLAGFPGPKTATALVDLLGDRSKTNLNMDDRRFCDQAAAALLQMLDLETKFRLGIEIARRDQTIGDLKSWWTANKESLDWGPLQARAKEARRSRR